MVYDVVYRYGNNNCQTAHPTRAPLCLLRVPTAAVRSYINDDESTVPGTDVPFAGSRDTVGKKGEKLGLVEDGHAVLAPQIRTIRGWSRGLSPTAF